MCHTNKNKIKLTTKEHDSSRLMVSTSQISGLVTSPVKKNPANQATTIDNEGDMEPTICTLTFKRFLNFYISSSILCIWLICDNWIRSFLSDPVVLNWVWSRNVLHIVARLHGYCCGKWCKMQLTTYVHTEKKTNRLDNSKGGENYFIFLYLVLCLFMCWAGK